MNFLSVSTCWYYTTVFFSLSFVLLLLLVGLVFIVFLLQGFPLNQSIRGSFLEEAAAASLFCFVCFPAGFFWAFFLAKDFLGLFNIPVAGGQKIFLLGEMSKKETLWRLEGKKKKKRFLSFLGICVKNGFPYPNQSLTFAHFPGKKTWGLVECVHNIQSVTHVRTSFKIITAVVLLCFSSSIGLNPPPPIDLQTHTQRRNSWNTNFSLSLELGESHSPLKEKRKFFFYFWVPFLGKRRIDFFFAGPAPPETPQKVIGRVCR